jgi:peptide/nickel transport system permease protein
MWRQIGLRLLGAAATVLAASVVVFAVVRFLPGDPLTSRLEQGSLPPEARAEVYRRYGLDQPIAEQFLRWLRSMLQGDLGSSFLTDAPISPELAARVPRTVVLALAGLAVAMAYGGLAGILAARFRGGPVDSAISAVNALVISMPVFFFGLLLVVVFAVRLGWLPVGGYAGSEASLGDSLRGLVLPALTLGALPGAFIARMLRSSLIEQLDQDYVRTAVARGFGSTRTLLRHALRNASLPTITVLGVEFASLLGGAIVVEALFSYPGMGSWLVESILQRDYPIVQVALLFFAVSFVLLNLLVDLTYQLVDPRLRTAR